MGKSTLLATTLGALAIGARAGAVDLTEGDFDAQVFESGKVRRLALDYVPDLSLLIEMV